MKKKELRKLFVLMIVSATMTGFSCASNRVNLLKDGNIKIERISSKDYEISHVDVYLDNGALVVQGNVERHGHSGTETGHVDIAVVSPGGEVLDQISTLYKPRIIPARMIFRRKAYFTARLPMIPPKGSTVRVAYHRDSKPGGKTFSCGGNIAVPHHGR